MRWTIEIDLENDAFYQGNYFQGDVMESELIRILQEELIPEMQERGIYYDIRLKDKNGNSVGKATLDIDSIKEECRDMIKEWDKNRFTLVYDRYSEGWHMSQYVGSYLSLDPCGKYHHVISPNGVTTECIAFWDSINEIAENEFNGWLESGEGDPLDQYYCKGVNEDNIPRLLQEAEGWNLAIILDEMGEDAFSILFEDIGKEKFDSEFSDELRMMINERSI
jgi:hypothetical protein